MSKKNLDILARNQIHFVIQHVLQNLASLSNNNNVYVYSKHLDIVHDWELHYISLKIFLIADDMCLVKPLYSGNLGNDAKLYKLKLLSLFHIPQLLKNRLKIKVYLVFKVKVALY